MLVMLGQVAGHGEFSPHGNAECRHLVGAPHVEQGAVDDVETVGPCERIRILALDPRTDLMNTALRGGNHQQRQHIGGADVMDGRAHLVAPGIIDAFIDHLGAPCLPTAASE